MNRLLVVVALSLSSVALADVPPPNSQGCTNKAAGDACIDDANVARTCAASTCTKLDYSHGTPPGSITVACLLCGDASDAGPVTGAGGGGGAATTPKSGCTAVPGGLLAAAALFFALRRRP